MTRRLFPSAVTSVLAARRFAPYGRKPPASARIFLGHPLAAGFVGAWILNEGAGTRASDALGLNGGALQSIASWATDPSSGSDGLGVFCNSTEGTKILMDRLPPTFGAGNFTVAGRMLAQSGVNLRHMIASRGDTAATAHLWDLKLINSADAAGLGGGRVTGDVVFQIYDGTNNNQCTSVGTDWRGAVHTFAGVKSGTAMSVWVDGVQRNTLAATIGTYEAGGDQFGLGGLHFAGDTTEYLQGTLYWVMLWSRALAAAEIRALHENPYQVFARPAWSGGGSFGVAVLQTASTGFEIVASSSAVTLVWAYAARGRRSNLQIGHPGGVDVTAHNSTFRDYVVQVSSSPDGVAPYTLKRTATGILVESFPYTAAMNMADNGGVFTRFLKFTVQARDTNGFSSIPITRFVEVFS